MRGSTLGDPGEGIALGVGAIVDGSASLSTDDDSPPAR